MRSLKIVHCGIFNEYDDGSFFYGMERKISHGLIRGGHFVYDFSYRDWERSLRFCGLKNSGLKKMNAKLVSVCENIGADLLLIGKGEKIKFDTLSRIKKLLPKIKIIQWYADLRSADSGDFNKISLADAFFCTNATDLAEISRRNPNTLVSFMPNISDVAFDRNFESEKSYDVLYIGNDYLPNRKEFIETLKQLCVKEGIGIKIYGSLGEPFIFGERFQQEISRSKIAINFNADDGVWKPNQNKILYSSDRMAQFMGCGVCTFSPAIRGLDRFFADGRDVVYFNDVEDCFAKIKECLQNGSFEAIGRNGRARALEIVNATRVSKFMLELTFGLTLSEPYEWREFVYKNGEKFR